MGKMNTTYCERQTGKFRLNLKRCTDCRHLHQAIVGRQQGNVTKTLNCLTSHTIVFSFAFVGLKVIMYSTNHLVYRIIP